MSRTLAALAWVGLLSSTARAEPCAPRVELSGDSDAVARVGIELVRLGVTLASSETPPTTCATTAAVVERDERGISVAVQNASQRREVRVVSGIGVAATWIDSWVRDELEVASWSDAANPTPPPAVVVASVAVAPPSAATVRASIPTHRESALDLYSFSAGVARSWTNDATTWDGVDVSTCARIGPLCIGGRVRALSQTDLAHGTGTADRTEVVGLATASLPVSVGQIRISPELGLGVGRVRTKRTDMCSPSGPSGPDLPTCDPTDPGCVVDPITPTDCGDNYDSSSYLPRAAVGIRFSFPIAGHVWLDANASYAVSLFASTTSATGPLEPSSGSQLGLGVRVGLP